MNDYLERVIGAGMKEISMQKQSFDREYERVSNRIEKARLDMQERSKSRKLIKPQE